MINPLSNLQLSHFLLISGEIFGAPVCELRCLLFNDSILYHLNEPRVVLGLAKLLNQFNYVLRIRQVETLLRLDAALLEGAEDDARLCVLFLRSWIILGEEHGLEEEPNAMRIEKAAC